VTFIPPHLLQQVVERSEEVRQRDVFGKLRLAEGKYTSGDIDVSTWQEHIEADYLEWVKTNG
jgi:4-hydroxy-4-methyl-2-oxoglutarate aldolase